MNFDYCAPEVRSDPMFNVPKNNFYKTHIADLKKKTNMEAYIEHFKSNFLNKIKKNSKHTKLWHNAVPKKNIKNGVLLIFVQHK